MKNDFSQSVHIVSEKIRASLISREDSKLLKIDENSPCLKVKRTSYNKMQEPVEYTISVVRSGQFVYNYKCIHQEEH